MFILNAFLFVNVSIIFLNVTMEIPEEEDWIMFGNVMDKNKATMNIIVLINSFIWMCKGHVFHRLFSGFCNWFL